MRFRWVRLDALALHAPFTTRPVNLPGPLAPDQLERHRARIAGAHRALGARR